jgi:hypothetical protein
VLGSVHSEEWHALGQRDLRTVVRGFSVHRYLRYRIKIGTGIGTRGAETCCTFGQRASLGQSGGGKMKELGNTDWVVWFRKDERRRSGVGHVDRGGP